MADKLFDLSWETGLFREALKEIGDEESLLEFDLEQIELKIEATKSALESVKKGEIALSGEKLKKYTDGLKEDLKMLEHAQVEYKQNLIKFKE